MRLCKNSQSKKGSEYYTVWDYPVNSDRHPLCEQMKTTCNKETQACGLELPRNPPPLLSISPLISICSTVRYRSKSLTACKERETKKGEYRELVWCVLHLLTSPSIFSRTLFFPRPGRHLYFVIFPFSRFAVFIQYLMSFYLQHPFTSIEIWTSHLSLSTFWKHFYGVQDLVSFVRHWKNTIFWSVLCHHGFITTFPFHLWFSG